MNVVRSYEHEVYTETVYKIALSAEDDKRVVREDYTHTLDETTYSHLTLFQTTKFRLFQIERVCRRQF